MSAPYVILDTHINKQDKYLIAHDELIKHLAAIKQANLKNGDFVDPIETNPTLIDIHKTHNTFVRRHFRPFISSSFVYQKITPHVAGNIILSDTSTKITFDMSKNTGEFLGDGVIRISFPKVVAPAGKKVRYCAIPGVRLVKSVSLIANDITIDDYLMEDYLHELANNVDASIREVLLGMLGQEPIYDAKTAIPTAGLTQYFRIGCGAQTLKQEQPPLTLWIPLIFDFCRVERYLSNYMIKTQQFSLDVILAPLNEIITFIDDSGCLDKSLSSLSLANVELYMKNIYIRSDLLDCIGNKSNVQMIRCRRRHQVKNTISAAKTINLLGFKYQIEAMYFSFTPRANMSTGNIYSYDDWYKACQIVRTPIPFLNMFGGAICGASNSITLTTITVPKELPTVKTISIEIEGKPIYVEAPQSFYSGWTPVAAEHSAKAPLCGYYYAQFALMPKRFDPSSYVNTSTTRNLTLTYSSDFISPINACELYVGAQCLNFLTYNRNTIKLRYAT